MNNTTKQILEIFKNFRVCGLKQIVQHSEDKVCFYFKGGMQKKITMVTFEIDHAVDLYKISFGKIFKYDYKEISKFDHIYFDQLQEIFESETGYVVY